MKYPIGLIIALILLSSLSAANPAPVYKIQLQWDIMAGECNGILSGRIGTEQAVVQGAGSQTALQGKLVSLGESAIRDIGQLFEINASEGYFSFWVRDKFADDDLQADPNLISAAKPVVSVYRDNSLIQRYSLKEGYGLTCKVFTLDAESGEIIDDLRYFMQTKTILVKVVNALDGKALEDVDITLSGGDEAEISVVSDDQGIAFFNAEIGSYRLAISKPGFIKTDYPVEMGFDENPVEIVVALCPEVREYRIVLTWGSRPADLDAHLTGPNPEGKDFHIWYRNRIMIAGKDFLDRDDTSSYGPETITIYKPAKGEYLYAVHDYTNRQNSRSRALSNSDAVVQVYAENKLLQTFQIPRDMTGTLWKVFKIDKNQRLVAINSLTWITDERNIQH
jgi:hypothetical protein